MVSYVELETRTDDLYEQFRDTGRDSHPDNLRTAIRATSGQPSGQPQDCHPDNLVTAMSLI